MVTPADVTRAARRHVDPDRAVIVVVGDAVELLPRLDSIAPVVLYDVTIPHGSLSGSADARDRYTRSALQMIVFATAGWTGIGISHAPVARQPVTTPSVTRRLPRFRQP